jgi:8-oxo-dGTP diphosphatase
MKYWKPSITADMIIINEFNEVLLMKRNTNPWKDYWVLPGGFMDKEDSSLEETAIREVFEEINFKIETKIFNLGIFDEIGRDIRDRVITNAFYTYIKKEDFNGNTTGEASSLRWFKKDKLPEMGFDHAKIVVSIPSRFKLGIDIHGVLDTYPALLLNLAKLVKANGGEIHIMTGSSLIDVREQLISYTGDVWWDKVFSISDYVIKRGAWRDDKGHVWTNDIDWNRAKGDYGKENNITLHIDDSPDYGQYFEKGTFLLMNGYNPDEISKWVCSKIEEKI